MLEFSYPKFYMPFPAAMNPAADEGAASLIEWSTGFGLRPTEAAIRQFSRSRPDIYIARSFPNANPAILALLMQWVEWGFVIDDELDDGSGCQDVGPCRAAVLTLVDVIDGTSLPANTIAVALADLLSRTVTGRSPEWRRRFLTDLRNWLWTYYAQAVDRSAGSVPTLEEYRIHLRDAAGMLWFMDLHEIAADIELPEAVAYLPSHVSMRFAAVEHAGFFNDIISVRKEDPGRCVHNAIHILCRRNGVGIQDAAEQVNDIATECIVRFEAAEKALAVELAVIGVDEETYRGAIRCRDGYRALIRGIYDWHLEVDRYRHRESGRADVPDILPELFSISASAATS